MEFPQKIHPMRRDPYWLLKYIKLFIINLLLIGVLTYIYLFYRPFPSVVTRYNLQYYVPVAVLLYTLVWRTIKLEAKRKKKTFEFFNNRLAVKEGFGIEDSGWLAAIFFQEVSTDDVPYEQITHVNVSQSMEQQFGFIGTGDIEIYRPGKMRDVDGDGDIEKGEEKITMKGIKDPHKWEKLIMGADPSELEEDADSSPPPETRSGRREPSRRQDF